MADEVNRQQDRTPDVTEQGGDVKAGVRASNEAWREISDRSDAARQTTNNTATDRATGSNNQTTGSDLNLTNAFTQAQDKFNHFLEAMGWGGEKGEGKDKPKQFISAASCAACEVPKDQKGGGSSDAYTSHFRHSDKQTKPEVTLEQMKDGSLKRTSTSKNADGSSLTVTTKEEYVRDEKGEIKKDKDGRAITRVLQEDKEAKDKEGKVFFQAHKENHYNKNGDLEKSHEDLSRIGKDGKMGKLNSFDVKNEYDAAGKLTAHHASVNDANGKPMQTTDAKYSYDENGNRKTEDITRVRGEGKKTHEHREHTWEKFGDKYGIAKTESKLEDGGKLTTEFARDDKGVLTGERTIEKDKEERVRHEFQAAYNADGSRQFSRDVHKTFHDNGNEKTVTTSEFSQYGDSVANRVEKDENGKVVNERGLIQTDDGQILDQKTGNPLMSLDAGQALGEYWDKELAWSNLERLSGDATNRDVISGWDNLGRFAGGPGKQEAAVGKLQNWGRGSAWDGVSVLEQNFGNGDGQAAQGLDTYLSLGSGAAMKEASDKASAGFKNMVHGVAQLWMGGKNADGKGGIELLAEAGKNFGDAAEAIASTSEKAEEARKLIHKDAAVSGDLTTVHGNGSCSTGVCMLKKDGDAGKPEVAGEPDAVTRGILENLKWSPSGNFGEATMLRADIAGGNMIQLREMTAQMGTKETYENGQVVTHVSHMSGNDAMLQLGREEVPATKAGEAPTVRINPEQAVEQFKRAGIMPDGHYEPMQASKNFFEGGVTTAMTTDSQGRLTPVLDAEGKPVYLHSGERGVEAVLKVGGGSPVTGMDVMTELSSKKNEKGELVQVDMRVGFEQLPKIGETLVATENGKVVAVRDSLVSAQTILNYGEPARDAQGNPVPVRDAQGREIPAGVVGAQALTEVTRTAAGTDGARIYESLQAATGNERAMFEKAVAKAAAEGRMESLPTTTFSPAESTRESLQFIGRTEGQTVGSALEGARLVTREQTTPDGRTFTISPDGSVVGGLNAIRQADSVPAEQKTVMGGAQEIALFTARQEGQPSAVGQRVERDEFGFPKPMVAPEGGRGQTFSEGAANTAMMADRTTTVGGAQQPLESSQLFTNGISNVQSYAKDGTFSGGRETVTVIGGGADRPDAVTRGIEQIRTAADTTTAGSVSQLATVTAAAGGGDPRVGAESMMTYRGRDGEAKGSYSEGARQLYTDLYGAPNAPQNAHQTLQAADVERAVSIATPGTVQTERLQSGMDKTNEIVRASGNPDLNGSSVLTNLSNNQPAMEVVRQAASPVEARQALEQQGFYQAIVTPVPRNADGTMPTTTANATANTTAAAVEANAVKVAEQQKAAAAEAALVGNAPVVAPVVASGSPAAVETGARREVVAGGNNEVSIAAANSMTLNRNANSNTEMVSGANKFAEVVVAAAQKASEVKAAEVKAAEVKAAEVKAAEVKAAEVKAASDAIAQTVRQVLAAAVGSNNEVREVRPVANVQQTLGGERGMFKTIGDQVAGSLQSIIASAKSISTAAATTDAGRALSTNITVANAMTAKAVNVAVSSDAAAVQRATAAANNVYVNLAAAANGNAVLAKAAAAGVSITGASTAARVGDIAAIRTGGSVAIGVDGRPMTLRASVSDSTTAATNARSMDLMFGRTFRTIGNGIDGNVVKGDLKATKLRAKKFRKLGEDDLAMLGAEIALVALLVSSSIAKEKAQQAETKKKAEAAEFAKASDAAADVVELDKANIQSAYKVLTRPTWLVRKGEDLVKLAEHLFHEAELGWLIADLNMGQTKESYVDGKRVVELKERQRIEIPVSEDIIHFHKTMTKQMAPENLVTIVAENAVDTELMNATLGLAMGATTEAARPAVPAAAPLPAPKPALVLAGLAKEAKEGDRRPLLANAKRAAMLVRRAATTAVVKDQDQGPTAPAVATTEELRPKYV